jgi:hypothetical protein
MEYDISVAEARQVLGLDSDPSGHILEMEKQNVEIGDEKV